VKVAARREDPSVPHDLQAYFNKVHCTAVERRCLIALRWSRGKPLTAAAYDAIRVALLPGTAPGVARERAWELPRELAWEVRGLAQLMQRTPADVLADIVTDALRPPWQERRWGEAT